MQKKRLFYGWLIVIALTVNLAILGPAAVSVANLFQTSVTGEFAISNSSFAMNNLIVLGSGIFFSPILSSALNRKHYKKILSIGTIAYGLGLIGYGFAQNISSFYIFSLLVGFGYIATTLMPTSIFINNWFVEKRGLALSIAISGLGIGGFILSPLLTALIEGLGWRMTYIIYCILMIAIGIPIIIFVLFLKPEMKSLQAYGAEILDQKLDSSKGTEKDQALDLVAEKSKRKSFFILLILGTALVGIANNGA